MTPIQVSPSAPLNHPLMYSFDGYKRRAMKRFWFLLFPLCFIFPLSTNADQLDPRLDELFQRLQSTSDSVVAAEIESIIWQVWTENDNPDFIGLMDKGIQQMSGNALSAALGDFDRLIEIAPDFAEAWNKRATIYYLLKDYRASEADISTTLMLEPKHFGALSGLGLVYMALGEYYLARNAFNAALEINPNMQGVKNNLEALESFFRNSAI